MSELNLHDLIDDAADTEVDMNEAQQGGGDYTPPAEGLARLRFVTYIELGKQDGTYQGKPKVSDKVVLGFELHGVKWPADENGRQPYVEFEMNKSLTDKAGFFKLFKAMNWEGTAKIMAQLLGKEFVGKVLHRKYKRRDGKEGVAVEFYDKVQKLYTIRSPHREDEDGESVRVTVPPATRELQLFLWSKPHKAMWDSIFIDGEWEERKNEDGEVTAPAKSKNKHQLAIKAAKNFPGSPAEALLEGVDDEMLNEAGRETDPKKAVEKKKAESVKQADQETSKPAASESKKKEAPKAKEPEPEAEASDEDELNTPDLPF